MGAETDTPPPGGIKPPVDIEDRRAQVHTVAANTLEIPFDPHDPDFARYFDQGAGMRPITHGNEVTGFISGAEALENMAAAIETADSFDHYIYMMNWFVDLKLDLASGKVLDNLLLAAQKNHVQIRGLFWDQVNFQNLPSHSVLDQNNKAVSRLNDTSIFPGAAAILDDNTINRAPLLPIALFGGIGFLYFATQFLPGSHHQKVLVVKGREGLIAFVGGVDFNPDRIHQVSLQPGSPMHDVHCRIQGPAARQVLQVFLDRWQDHPESVKLKARGVTDLRGLNEPVPGAAGDKHVQIGCTFGDGKAHGGIRNVNGGNFYTFAPDGDRSAQRLIEMAILRSEHFIYIEDQYLVSRAAAISLNVALGNPQLRVIILIPHSSISDHPHVWKMRKEFVDLLLKGLSKEDSDKRVVVCYRKRFGDTPNAKVIDKDIPESYIHAKMMIVDDKYAMIGSANCGLRSYTHDSEIVAGIYDESQDKPGVIHFAHKLRIRLWAKHLALTEREVYDPIAAAVHWTNPDPSSAIGVYKAAADTDAILSLNNRIVSESQAEPYGGVPGKELSP